MRWKLLNKGLTLYKQRRISRPKHRSKGCPGRKRLTCFQHFTRVGDCKGDWLGDCSNRRNMPSLERSWNDGWNEVEASMKPAAS
jgi:hypothetical protein